LILGTILLIVSSNAFFILGAILSTVLSLPLSARQIVVLPFFDYAFLILTIVFIGLVSPHLVHFFSCIKKSPIRINWCACRWRPFGGQET
jgi:hypothetical protein